MKRSAQKRDCEGGQVQKIAAVLDANPDAYFRVPVLLDILETYAGYLKPSAPADKSRRAANLSAFLGRRCESNNRGYAHSWNHERDPAFTHGVKYLFYSKFCKGAALREMTVEKFKAGLVALDAQAQQLAVGWEVDVEGKLSSPLLAVVSASPAHVLPAGRGTAEWSALESAPKLAVAAPSTAVSRTPEEGTALGLIKEQAGGLVNFFEEGPANDMAFASSSVPRIGGEVAGPLVARSLDESGCGSLALPIIVPLCYPEVPVVEVGSMGVMHKRHKRELQELQEVHAQQAQELCISPHSWDCQNGAILD
jgi:hypothetical protein